MEIHIPTAVGTDKDTGKHVVASIVLSALANLAPFLLHLLPIYPVNDGFVNIPKDRHIFLTVGYPLLMLVGLGIGLEVDNITAIFL